jgi:hypothetical protein
MNDKILELRDIGKRIHNCFEFVENTITDEELTEFIAYVTTQEAAAPFFSPTEYMALTDTHPNIFTVVKERAEILKTVLKQGVQE